MPQQKIYLVGAGIEGSVLVENLHADHIFLQLTSPAGDGFADDEAEKAFERSIALDPAVISVVVHMAQLQVLKGNKTRAVELIGTLSGKQSELSADSSRELENVKKSLGGM